MSSGQQYPKSGQYCSKWGYKVPRGFVCNLMVIGANGRLEKGLNLKHRKISSGYCNIVSIKILQLGPPKSGQRIALNRETLLNVPLGLQGRRVHSQDRQ